jgi:hypothetical protein
LDQLPILVGTQISCYFGSLCGVYGRIHNGSPFVFGCHSMDMSRILVHVKFEDGLSILILRTRQFFTKKQMDPKPMSFQNVQIFQNVSPYTPASSIRSGLSHPRPTR